MRVILIVMLAAMSTMGYGQTDSVKVPKVLLHELATYVAPASVDVPINIGTVRTAGLYALSVVSNSGFGGRELLISLQNSPYDEAYFSKGLLVGQNYIAEIRTNYAGEQVIVFKRKK